jgi:UDP:flavonoid glycosyltransferase YjiC (YdhE family)
MVAAAVPPRRVVGCERVSRRIVITCLGSYGDVFPYIGVARALQARGHQTLIAASATYRTAVEQEGVAFAPLGPDVNLRDEAALARVMDARRGGEVVIKEFVLPALAQMYDETLRLADGADVLVSHPLTFATPAVAAARGLPWAATILAPLSLFSDTDFPVLPGFPALAAAMRRWPWLRRTLMRLVRRETAKWTVPLDDLRARHGLPPAGNPVLEGQYSPYLNLALFSRVMAEPQPDWPPRTRVTGFVFYNGPAALPPEVEAFLAAGPPPIVFTLGSSAVGAAGRFYHESADAAARLGARAVLLTGGFAANQPAQVPRDVLLVDRAPHQLLFPRARAVVHQGGAGTTAQALRAGCPMLVVPHSHDQPDNAARVVRLGVARTLLPKRYTAARAAAELRRLLDDAGYAEHARSVAAIVASERGADGAAEALASVALTAVA